MLIRKHNLNNGQTGSLGSTYPHHILMRMRNGVLTTFVQKVLLNLKRVIMLTTNDVAKVYDSILSIPGMNETVKTSRKNVLLLNHVIERGLSAKDDDESSSFFPMFLKKVFRN